MVDIHANNTSLRDFLHFVFKRKRQILLTVFVVFAVVAAGTFLTSPTYEANAKILVKLGRENIYVPTMPATGNQQNPIINNNREEQINSEIQILTSQSLLEKVVATIGPSALYDIQGQKRIRASESSAAFRVDDDDTPSPLKKAVMKLKKNLSVEGIKKSNVIEIRFKHKDPRIAADVTNNLVELFLDRHLEVYMAPQSYMFFSKQSQILKDKLAKSEKQQEMYKREQNVSMLDHEREMLLTSESALRNELNQTLSKIAETESRIGKLKNQLRVIPKTVNLAEEFEASHYIINTLQGRLVELQLNEQKLLTKYTPENRMVLNIRDEIGIVQQKLKEHENKTYRQNRSVMNTTFQQIQKTLLSNQSEFNALQAKTESQIRHLDEYQQKLDKLNSIESTMVELKRRVEIDRLNYNLYLTKIEESRISKAMDSEKIANLAPIQKATPPVKPISPKKRLNLILGLFMGIFGSLLLALLMEHLDDTLEMPEDAENSLSLPVLASVPDMSG